MRASDPAAASPARERDHAAPPPPGPGRGPGCSFPASSSRARCSASRAIGLDLVAGRARDLRRRRDHTLDPALRELARERVPGRAGLVSDPDRSRQPGAEPGRRRVSPFIANDLSSPVSASRTAATIFAACTSRPTRVLAFAMAGSSYAVVGRRAGCQPRGHDFTPTNHRGEPASSTAQAGRTDNPYGLCKDAGIGAHAVRPERASPATVRWLSHPKAKGRAGQGGDGHSVARRATGAVLAPVVAVRAVPAAGSRSSARS